MQIISLDGAREMLEHSQRPFFLYDNDADGLCSMTLLRRWLGRGSSEVVRSAPDIDEKYAASALSSQPDLVVVLDRPLLGASFVSTLSSANIPILWIDHHLVEVPEFGEFVFYHNPHSLKQEPVPVTALCYKLTGRKEDSWIAMMGCIADHHLPSFKTLFAKKYPSFWGKVKLPFDAYFETEIGTIARAFGFGIKDSLSAVKYLENFLLTCPSPERAREELDSESSLASHYRLLFNRYKILYQSASADAGKIIFFVYRGTLSMSAELANELSYRFPKKMVVVAYAQGPIANISIRGKNALKILNAVLPLFPGASGGGHPEAVGARMRSTYLDDFKASILEKI